MASFNPDNYSESYGPSLAAAAGENIVGQQGGLDQSGVTYDPNLEANVQRANQNTTAANLPSPYNQERLMRLQRPPPASTSSSLSAANPSPDHSAQVYDAVDQMPDSHLKATMDNATDQIAAGQDQHGHHDWDSVWQATYQDKLKQATQDRQMDEQQADQAQNPTWRDKAAMMLDTVSRSAQLRAMNPNLSKSQIFVLASHGAQEGWLDHVQGQHDAYMKSQQQLRDQAAQAADRSVKFQFDQLGLQQKAQNDYENRQHQALQDKLAQEKQDEEVRHNKATESDTQAKTRQETSKSEQGDLTTGPDGNLYRVKGDKATPVTDKDGNPVKGTKTGVNAPKADTGGIPYDKAEKAWTDFSASYKKDPKYIGKPMDAEQAAKADFAKQNPRAYQAFFGNEPDTSAPAPAPATNQPAMRPWQQ